MHGRIEVNSNPAGQHLQFTARLPSPNRPRRPITPDWTLENMPALIVTGGERQNCPLCEMIRNWQMQPVQAEVRAAPSNSSKVTPQRDKRSRWSFLGDSPGNDDVFEFARSIQHNRWSALGS